MPDPMVSRPHMPGYGISEDDEGLLPWAWAEERLAKSHNYWVATARPDGRPHAMPVWAVWLDDRLYFSTAR
ncbi:MAG TPA: pyridoxamine 5'-phosphate oxidase family protein, partial [Dehalococcoidia bacterium]|nr:pyridoxamine 5'-phosphate oxidase family protein [Dehalococcoidia bacterium]